MFFLSFAQRVDYATDYRRMVDRLSHFAQGILVVTDTALGDIKPMLRRTLAAAESQPDDHQRRNDAGTNRSLVDREQAVAGLAGLFGFMALVLAAVGVYGVTAYRSASRRTKSASG